ncbi:alpha/beta fold hydrolase [Ancylobacter terrae]|uniref:alpha/beta fold hydrolase n=1 Tax=Ancylobacter sp. sgz301288 TaxID=3342077 RepID=UPI0038596584
MAASLRNPEATVAASNGDSACVPRFDGVDSADAASHYDAQGARLSPSHAKSIDVIFASPLPGRTFSLLAALSIVLAVLSPVNGQTVQPTVLLLDGLGVYMENNYVGVSTLAAALRRQGYRAVVDTHMMLKSEQERPDIIIGHSMGGTSALRRARQMVRAGEQEPLVITIDAAPGSPSCPVSRCINIHGPGFPDIAGAQNIDAWDVSGRMVPHALLATNDAIQRLILEQTATQMASLAARNAPPPITGAVPLPRPRPD